MNRLKQLEALVRAQPDNPFALYSLAMETKKTDPGGAVTLFRGLIQKHPTYVATYYQLGKALEEQEDTAGARAIYEAGLEAAQKAGDHHTASEIQGALDLL